MNAAIILCGGMSRRLGRDKSQVDLGGTTLISHVLRAACQAVSVVRVVGRSEQQTLAVIPDEFRELSSFIVDANPNCGPLEGLRSGLASLPESTRFALLCGCDYPFINPELIERLFELANGFDVAVPWIDGMLVPIPAVYSTGVAEQIQTLLARGERRLWQLAEQCNARRVLRQELLDVDPGLHSLLNVNDSQSLAVVERIWSQRSARRPHV